MEDVLIGGWDLIVIGCGGTATLSLRETLVAGWLYETLANYKQCSGVGVFTL